MFYKADNFDNFAVKLKRSPTPSNSGAHSESYIFLTLEKNSTVLDTN